MGKEYPKYVRVEGQPDFKANTPEEEAAHLAKFAPPPAVPLDTDKMPLHKVDADQPDLL